MIAGKHLLILEDEPIIAFALEDMLIEEGAAVTSSSSIDQAMAALSQATFDYAILDVNLHGSKSYPVGYELLKREIPFMFATGYGEAEHPDALAQIVTLTKPYSIGQILAAMERIGS